VAVALPRGRLAALASHEEGIAEQVWDRRQGDADAAAKKFRNRLDEQRRLKSALLRAKLNGEISQADYALANTEFDYEIAVIEARLQNAQANHVTRAAFLRFANAMLLDVAGAWQRAGAEQKCVFKIFCFKMVCTTRKNTESLNTLTLACSIRWKK